MCLKSLFHTYVYSSPSMVRLNGESDLLLHGCWIELAKPCSEIYPRIREQNDDAKHRHENKNKRGVKNQYCYGYASRVGTSPMLKACSDHCFSL
jgi:hypothetical protein